MASEAVKKSFSNNMKHLMVKYDLTEKDIATKLNISQSAVNHWKHGLSCPRGDMLVGLARVFGVTTAMLLNKNESTTNCLILDEEEKLLHDYRELTPSMKRILMATARKLAQESWHERAEKQL